MADTTEADELLDTADVARWLKVSKRTVESWRNAGTGPRFISVGRHIRYRRAAITAYLDEQEHAAAATR